MTTPRAASQLRMWLPLVVLAASAQLLVLRFGGYHVRHFGWVVLGLAAWACFQAGRGRLSALGSLAGVATSAMVLLVLWTTASITWVDASRHDAWVEAVRVAGYAAAFVLGGSLLASARSSIRFAMLVGSGTALLAVATAGRMRLDDAPLRLFVAGRLDWPIGYAPGVAGLYLVGALLLLGVSAAADRRWGRAQDQLDLVASGLALGGAGCCAALAFVAQSRGTLPALAVGVAVSLGAMPNRISWLVRAAAVGAALVVARASLTEPFQAQFQLRQAPFTEGSNADALLAAAERAAQEAGLAAIAILVLLAVLGTALPLVAARFDGEFTVSGAWAAAAIVASVLVAGFGFTQATDRSPAAWVSDQWEGCIDPPERVNDPGSATSYFANAGTGRCDYYRVALGNVRDEPLLGVGAGNFRSTYVRERETAEEPRVAHSLPLQLLGELGIIGGLLGAVVVGCVATAAWRFVASGPARDPAMAGILGALGYWVAHASIDWLWQLPGVSLPALVLAGGLVACVSPAQPRVRAAVAGPVATGVLLATVALVLPMTMADAALRTARDPDLRSEDPAAALEAARDAQRYDPTWAEAAITEAAIEAAAGRRGPAATAARRAVRLEPRSWAVQFRASGLIGLDDTQEGLEAFRRARGLNPQLPATVAKPAPQASDPDRPGTADA